MVKLSKEEMEYLRYLAEDQGEPSPAALISRMIHDMMDDDNAHCVDPRRNKLLAWRLKRQGRPLPRQRCSPKKAMCPNCVLSYSREDIPMVDRLGAVAVA